MQHGVKRAHALQSGARAALPDPKLVNRVLTGPQVLRLAALLSGGTRACCTNMRSPASRRAFWQASNVRFFEAAGRLRIPMIVNADSDPS